LYLGQGNSEKARPYFQEACRLVASESYGGPWGIEFLAFPTFFALLGGLEEAFQDPKAFHTFCRRLQQEHLKIYPYLVQWYLEPATVGAFSARLLRDSFTDRLAPEWTWLDPMGDCSYRVHDALELYAANGRSLWRTNWSAPRLLQPVSGSFSTQTVCLPVSDDKPAMGGLLLWVDRRNYLRLDRGVCGTREIAFTGCLDGKDILVGRGRLVEASERFYLRLTRVGEQVRAFCGADGENWYTVGCVTFPTQDPIQIGVHAIGVIDRTIYIGAYPEGTAIRFEGFQLWQTSPSQ